MRIASSSADYGTVPKIGECNLGADQEQHYVLAQWPYLRASSFIDNDHYRSDHSFMKTQESIPRVHVPIQRPEDVIPHLGSPTHWQPGRSAKFLADVWFEANGIPSSVQSVLSADPVFSSATLIDAFLERSVDLQDGARPSQTDLMAIVGLGDKIGILAVEAKVDEPFGPTVSEWLAQSKDDDTSKRIRIGAETFGTN